MSLDSKTTGWDALLLLVKHCVVARGGAISMQYLVQENLNKFFKRKVGQIKWLECLRSVLYLISSREIPLSGTDCKLTGPCLSHLSPAEASALLEEMLSSLARKRRDEESPVESVARSLDPITALQLLSDLSMAEQVSKEEEEEENARALCCTELPPHVRHFFPTPPVAD